MGKMDIISTITDRIKGRKLSIMNMGYYFMASFIPMVINLFLSPVYSLYMTAEDFAIVGYFTSLTALFSPFILFYMNQFYMREYFFRQGKDRENLRATLYKANIIFPFIVTALVLLCVYAYMCIINKESNISFSPYAFISFFTIAFAGIYRLDLIDFKVQRKGKQYLGISVVNTLFLLFFSVLFVVVLKLGATGKLLGTMMPALAMFIWSFRRHTDLFRFTFDWHLFKDSLVFCAPLVLAAMMGFFSGGYDKVYLERHVTLNQLGVYSIGLTIASYLNVFSTAIGETFGPDIYESIAAENNKRAIQFILIQLGIMLCIVIAFILLAKYAIIILTANRYVDSTPYARIASIAAITNMIYFNITPYILAKKKTNIILFAKITGGIACIITYSVVIKQFGCVGAAWCFALCPLYFTLFAIVFYMLCRLATKTKEI